MYIYYQGVILVDISIKCKKKFDMYVGIKYTYHVTVLQRHTERRNFSVENNKELILTSDIKIDEEVYDITEILKEETHKNIIRMEMNSIEYPLFTKNKKIKEKDKGKIITEETN